MSLGNAKLTVDGEEVMITNITTSFGGHDDYTEVELKGRIYTVKPEEVYVHVGNGEYRKKEDAEYVDDGMGNYVQRCKLPFGHPYKTSNLPSKTEGKVIMTITPEGNEFFKNFYLNNWNYATDFGIGEDASYIMREQVDEYGFKKWSSHKIKPLLKEDLKAALTALEDMNKDKEETMCLETDNIEQATKSPDNYYGKQLSRKYSQLGMSEEDRLLRAHDIVDVEGVLTKTGESLLLNMLFKKYKKSVAHAVGTIEGQQRQDEKNGIYL